MAVPILMYESESWTVTKRERSCIGPTVCRDEIYEICKADKIKN